MEHVPTGTAKVVVWPDAEHPRSPITVLIECSCGDAECYWSATAYDPVNVQPPERRALRPQLSCLAS